MSAAKALLTKDRGPSFLPLMAGATTSLVLSAITLTGNQFYQQLRDLTQTTQGGSMFDLLVGVGCFMVLLVGLLDRSKIVIAHYLSAALFAPSVLAFSQADWLAAAGFKGGFSAFRSNFSEGQLLFIGLIVLALFLLHYALNRSGQIANELRRAGGEEREVTAATDRLVLNRVWTLVLAAVATLAIYAVIAYLSPWLGALLASAPGAFVVVLAVAAVAALAMFVHMLRSRGPACQANAEEAEELR